MFDPHEGVLTGNVTSREPTSGQCRKQTDHGPDGGISPIDPIGDVVGVHHSNNGHRAIAHTHAEAHPEEGPRQAQQQSLMNHHTHEVTSSGPDNAEQSEHPPLLTSANSECCGCDSGYDNSREHPSGQYQRKHVPFEGVSLTGTLFGTAVGDAHPGRIKLLDLLPRERCTVDVISELSTTGQRAARGYPERWTIPRPFFPDHPSDGVPVPVDGYSGPHRPAIIFRSTGGHPDVIAGRHGATRELHAVGTHSRQVHRLNRCRQGGKPPGNASLGSPQGVQLVARQPQVGQSRLLLGSLVRIWLGTVVTVRVSRPLLGTVTIPI